MFRPTYVPLATSVLLVLGLISSYIICVQTGHCPLRVPSLCDLAAFPPARCLFGLVFSSTACLCLFVFLIHQRYIGLRSEELNIDVCTLNTLSFVCQGAMVTAMWIFANFQLEALVTFSQVVGFAAGVGFVICDLLISLNFYPNGNTKTECFLRVVCTLWILISAVAYNMCHMYSNAMEISALLGIFVWIAAYSYEFQDCLVGIDFDLKTLRLQRIL